MTTFNDREQAFEAKFAHDEELRFRAQARCNKILGLWAAELLDLSGDAAKSYAATVVSADLQEPGHEDVVRKISADLKGKATDDVIREKMALFLRQAQKEILAEV